MTEALISPLRAGSPLRAPRAAAVAGIIFSGALDRWRSRTDHSICPR